MLIMRGIEIKKSELKRKLEKTLNEKNFPEWITINHLYHAFLKDCKSNGYTLSDINSDNSFSQAIIDTIESNYENDEFEIGAEDAEIKDFKLDISDEDILTVKKLVKKRFEMAIPYLTDDIIIDILLDSGDLLIATKLNFLSDTRYREALISKLSHKLTGFDYPESSTGMKLFIQRMFLHNEEVGMQYVIDKLKKLNLTVSTAESVTGGRLQAYFTMIAGSSDVFLGGITAYDIENKVSQLGVTREEAEKVNCVSESVAKEMACGAEKMFGAHVNISTTGYEMEYEFNDNIIKPIVYVCFKTPNSDSVFDIKGQLYTWGKTREQRIRNICGSVMAMLIGTLLIKDIESEELNLASPDSEVLQP